MRDIALDPVARRRSQGQRTTTRQPNVLFATANFVAAGCIAAVGVATLRHVQQPRAVLFATVPLLFARHQFTEGFVWLRLGLDHDLRPEALGHVTFMFISARKASCRS